VILEEHFKYREELLDQSKDEEGFIEENAILSQILPSMLDAKLVDSEDFTNAYFYLRSENLKLNAYNVNETGERLLLYLIDENSVDLSLSIDDCQSSRKSTYLKQFMRCVKFLNKAFKGHLMEDLQESEPVRPLVSFLFSSQGVKQIDVVEIFLISLYSTVSLRGKTTQPARIELDDDSLLVSFQKGRERQKKELLIKKRIIDLNFLYNVLISQGNREALTIDFTKTFGEPISAIKAADEDFFESYLCALPANTISRLYKEYSTRLLEKNVRSFLQFRGVNKGIRETIRKEPEKFVAYNNGLTITATSGDIKFDSCQFIINSLTDFQIVNGGQTTATIYFTHKDGFDVSKVKVMAKINVAKDLSDDELEELISNISTYSNAQSRVSKVDLRSRNPQLIQIKSLSESVLTPSGKKWFFERAKGEFNTKLRIAGANKKRLVKEFPPERRFSKELMAKYYSAWGNTPHLVKKGGEKIFRYFIEKLTGEGDFKKPVKVDRFFYEELISKIILFRRLEKIYGSGKNSMGQLRSAVVPYTLSILYQITDGNKNSPSFNMLKIWLNEGLGEDLEDYLRSLLKLMNDLIKTYSESDDYGEYSKKEELWNSIKQSKEISSFLSSKDTEQIIQIYGIDKSELAEKRNEQANLTEVDFGNLCDNVLIHSNGQSYYEEIGSIYGATKDSEKTYISRIISAIIKQDDLSDKLIEFERILTNSVRIKNPKLFDEVKRNDDLLYTTCNYIIQEYNRCINNGKSISSEFSRIQAIAKSKKVKFSSVFEQIGKNLEKGKAPTVSQVYQASNYLNKNKSVSQIGVKDIDVDKIRIDAALMRKMFDWDSNAKVLSNNQRNYIAEYAWGLKKLNQYHKEIIRKYLKQLIEKGFKL